MSDISDMHILSRSRRHVKYIRQFLPTKAGAWFDEQHATSIHSCTAAARRKLGFADVVSSCTTLIDNSRKMLGNGAQRVGDGSVAVMAQGQAGVDGNPWVGERPICNFICEELFFGTGDDGAGDAFFSGTVMKLVEGCVLADAVAFGARLASATIGSEEATCPVGGGF